MKRFRNNKPLALALAFVMSATAILAATFAWFTSQDSVENHLYTHDFATGDVSIYEDFDFDKDHDPDDPSDEGWVPGTEIDKKVGAINTGDLPAFVRISFDEFFQKLGENGFTPVEYPYSPGSNAIPQLKPSLNYGENWFQLDSSNSTGIPNGVTIMAQQVGSGYKFDAYYTIPSPTGSAPSSYEGKYQQVLIPDGVITVNSIVTDSSGNVVTTFTVGNGLQYYQATLGAPETSDWTSATLSYYGPTDSVPSQIPDAGEYISLLFESGMVIDASDISSMDSDSYMGKWAYDHATGWFYYLGVLNPGESSPLLLTGLYLDSEAAFDPSWKYMEYDLTVNLDACEATDGYAAYFGTLPNSIYNVYQTLIGATTTSTAT